MADTTATSQSKSQNSASESSTATDAQDQKTVKTGADQASGSTDNDTSQHNADDVEAHIAAIRRDSRNSERRRVANILKANGFDASPKNLDDVLKGLKADSAKKNTSNDTTSKKDTKTDDATSDESKLLRTRLQELERQLAEESTKSRRTVIDAALSRAVAGVDFANERAADDALIAFSNAYEFELADDGRTVRVLGNDGEPVVNKKTYKELTLREAFDQFLADRPHFKKAEAKKSTVTTAQKGTGKTDTDARAAFNDALRKAAGV